MKFFDKMSEFNEVYQNLYLECNEELEKQKRKAKTKQAKYIGILLCTFVAVLLIIMIASNRGYVPDTSSMKMPTYVGCIIVICLSLLGNSYTKAHESYNKIFKEKVIQSMVKSYSKNLNYKYRAGASRITYINGEFEGFDLFKSEDGISGILEQDYKINLSEVHTERKQKTRNGHINYVTVFHGLFAEIETNQYVPCTIKIRKNTIKIFDSNDRIEMDSGEFEKIYDIYSKNKIVAMQIFTSDVLQLFVDFKEFMPEVTIKNNKIYVRFETGNTFEASLSKEVLDYETLKKYYYMIGFVLHFAKELHKNIKEDEIGDKQLN